MFSKRKFEGLIYLVQTYIRQETIDPIRSVFRSLIYGISGGLLLSLGSVFFSLAIVDFMQSYEVFSGWWSCIPFFGASIGLLLVSVATFKLLVRSKNERE